MYGIQCTDKPCKTSSTQAPWRYTLFGEVFRGMGKMGNLVVLLLAEQKKKWNLTIFYARATRGRGLPSLDARSGRSISPHL